MLIDYSFVHALNNLKHIRCMVSSEKKLQACYGLSLVSVCCDLHMPVQAYTRISYIVLRCLHAETVVAAAQAPVEGAPPAITITSEDEHVAAAMEDKNKGAYEQLKELLVSDKQQVRDR